MHMVGIFTFELDYNYCIIAQMHSLCGNSIGAAGAQAVAEYLQYCTHLQKLK